jgi:O-antigen/teichoic acid export membrane protein
MKTERLIFQNTVFLALGRGLGDLFSLIFLVYFARTFGADLLGKYGFAMSVGGLLTVLVNLGLNTYLVRDVSRDRSQGPKYVGNLLLAKTVLAILVWGLIGLIALSFNFTHDTKIILLLIGSYHVFYKLSTLFGAAFRAHEKMQYPALLEISHKVIILIMGILAITFWKNPLVALASYPISGFLRLFLGFGIFVSKYGWPDFKPDYVFIKNSLFNAMPLFAIIILAEFYDRIGMILLTFFQGEGEAGIYWAADRLVVTLAIGMVMFAAAIFPSMSRLSSQSNDQLYRLYERAVRLIAITMLPISTLFFLTSEPIILALFGDKFVESTSVLRIVAWVLFFKGMNLMGSALLLATHRQSQWVKLQLVAYLGYAAACIALLPLYSYIGLATTKLLAEAALAAMGYMYVRKQLHDVQLIKLAGGTAAACLLTILVFQFVPEISLWISVPSILFVCIAMMFLFKGVQTHDVIFVKKILWAASPPVNESKAGY